MTNLKYSFIVPVRNGEATLEKTLESIQRQSMRNFELIVVDNASEDRTAKIAKNFNCKYVFHKYIGRSKARNAGAILAEGQYLVFVDADVILAKTWLNQVDRVLKRLPMDGLTTKIVPFKEDNSLLNRFRFLYGAQRTGGTFINIHHSDKGVLPLINTAACVFLKKSFDSIGGFDETLARHEDFELSLRLFCGGYLLGGTRHARSKVVFKTLHQYPLSDFVAYLERSFEVSRLSLWPAPWKKSLSLDLVRAALKKSRRLDLLTLAVCVELASAAGRLTRSAKVARLDFRRPGPNALRFSFLQKNSIFSLKKKVNFIFSDESVYVLDGPFRSRLLRPELGSILLKLVEGKKIPRKSISKLLKTGFFRPLGPAKVGGNQKNG
jgi:glycosyltransferase involved in cell wall biosynthesis